MCLIQSVKKYCRKEQWNALPYYMWARYLLSKSTKPVPLQACMKAGAFSWHWSGDREDQPPWSWWLLAPLCIHPTLPAHPPFLPPYLPPSPTTQALIFGLLEVAFHWALMLPRHCWGEQTASQPVKLYFLATCLKLQLPDMANEFYNQKLKWISCSRCFYSGNYQTFLAAHLSFKRIKLCTSIMCCHWSIAQLYQTFYSGNWINFLQGFFCVAL